MAVGIKARRPEEALQGPSAALDVPHEEDGIAGPRGILSDAGQVGQGAFRGEGRADGTSVAGAARWMGGASPILAQGRRAYSSSAFTNTAPAS